MKGIGAAVHVNIAPRDNSVASAQRGVVCPPVNHSTLTTPLMALLNDFLQKTQSHILQRDTHTLAETHN